MKKIFTLILITIITGNVFAQDDKKFRFGLKAAPSLNWYKPDNTKKFESNGVGLGFSWGMMAEFKLSDVAAFHTGFEVQYDKGSLSFLNSTDGDAENVYYLINKDDELIKHEDESELQDGVILDSTSIQGQFIKLTERSYKVNYVSLPLTLKMGTKLIGYMKYYGQFGLIPSIKTKARANDEGINYPQGGSAKKEDLDITDDMQLFKFALTIGGGAEYNLSGSTFLVFGLNYNLGFSNVLKKESKYLFEYDADANTVNPVAQNASAHNIALTVGILF